METTLSIGGQSDYRALSGQVRRAGLLERRPGPYLARMALTLIAFAAGWAAFFYVGDSWAIVGVAVVLALVFTQVDFVGHDAGHMQVFRRHRINAAVGLVAGNLMTGLSFGWWVPKHNAHHAHPNVVGLDPDIGAGAVALSFSADIARGRRGFGRTLARYQAWFFFPLLVLEGAGLHISGVDSVVRRHDREAAVEGLLLAIHAAVYLTVVFWVLSPGRAVAFIAVQQGLYGLYLGCSFAPNHKGMPVLDEDSEMGFVRRQIDTSRNVTGGSFTSFMLGGLNFQIEHHLFPTMPRRNLAQAQVIVRAFCAEQNIAYHEDSLFGSYSQALRYLHMVGTA